jgi:hypothetical protein
MSDEDECIACEVGKYKSNQGSAACKNCPTGYWADAAASSCWTCLPGIMSPGFLKPK